MKKISKNKKGILACFFVSIMIICAASGMLLAKYITERSNSAGMISGDFYVSAQYLEGSGAECSVADWFEDGVVFELYNYEKANAALISDNDIKYSLSFTETWTVEVTDENGNAVLPDGGVYTLVGNGTEKNKHIIKLTTTNAEQSVLNVSVNTKSPYTKTLSAKFNLDGIPIPEYEITDNANYVLLTLRSNNYSGDVSVSWTGDFSPDNTNPYMEGWSDSLKHATLSVSKNTTYNLIFYKNTVQSYSKAKTKSTNVQIGGDIQ